MLEPLVEFLLGWLFGLGAEALSGLVQSEEQDAIAASMVKLAAVGVVAGLLSSVLLPYRLVKPRVGFPGVSILLAPLATGTAMHLVGKRLCHLGRHASNLATFWGGAVFAFSMALVRWWLVGAPH